VATIYYNTTTTPKLMILLYFFINISRPTILSPNDGLLPPHAPPLPSILHFRRLFLVGCCVCPHQMAAVLIKWWQPFNNAIS
jgi:hypothetical protein